MFLKATASLGLERATQIAGIKANGCHGIRPPPAVVRSLQ